MVRKILSPSKDPDPNKDFKESDPNFLLRIRDNNGNKREKPGVPNGCFQLLPHHGDDMEQLDGRLQQGLIEGEHHKDHLDVHLDDRLADQRRPEKGPERDQEVAARNAGQVEQRIGYGGAEEDAHESRPLHQHLYAVLPALVAGHAGRVLELLL